MNKGVLEKQLEIFRFHGEAGINKVPSDEKVLYQVLMLRYYKALENTTEIVFGMANEAYTNGLFSKEGAKAYIAKNFTRNDGVDKFIKAFFDGGDLEIVGRDLFIETIEYDSKKEHQPI